jgi:hypothetical protein
MSPRRSDVGDFQGGIAPLIQRVEGASDIQRLVIGRSLASSG